MNTFPDHPEALPTTNPELAPAGALAVPTLAALPDPAWNGWDLLRILCVSIVALVVCMLGTLLAAKKLVYPHVPVFELARNSVVLVAGQTLGYLLILSYMYVLVTRERRCPSFLSAIHWNFPLNPVPYLAIGCVLSVALQLLAHLLPIPKNLPIDNLFRTATDAWVLTIFGVTLAPLMEELLFRAFLYPVLHRHLGMEAAILLTSSAFALMHGSQLRFAWGPLLVIFMVGMVLATVRARRNSVAAGLLVHVSYNATISTLMFVGTGGFRHLERLNQ